MNRRKARPKKRTPMPKGVISPEKMERQALALGKLVGNLQSLELLIRRFLYARRVAPHKAFKTRRSMSSLQLGQQVPVNAYTSYATLKDLIRAYNKIASARFPQQTVDEKKMVELRDALAHGRIFSDTAGPPFYLYKFANPKKSAVTTVTVAEVLTPKWLRDQAKLVREECLKVASTRPRT